MLINNNNIIINNMLSRNIINYSSIDHIRVKKNILKTYWTYFARLMNLLGIVDSESISFIDTINLDQRLLTELTRDGIINDLTLLKEMTETRKNDISYYDMSNNKTIIISPYIYSTLINFLTTISTQTGNFNNMKRLIDDVFWCIDNWNDRDQNLLECSIIINRFLSEYAVEENLQPESRLRRVTCTNGDNDCIICLNEMETGSTQISLECGHLFHEECITDWLGINNTCPVCRREVREVD